MEHTCFHQVTWRNGTPPGTRVASHTAPSSAPATPRYDVKHDMPVPCLTAVPCGFEAPPNLAKLPAEGRLQPPLWRGCLRYSPGHHPMRSQAMAMLAMDTPKGAVVQPTCVA